jgi:hydroxymethylglutaryl-CoA lyase
MINKPSIHITETPRDALQGWPTHVPAYKKAEYMNALLKAGFETLDCGSFVSHKAVPQMADTGEVISLLETEKSETKLMVLVGNTRGGIQAVHEKKVDQIAFPTSVSETFLKRNLNSTSEKAWQTIMDLKAICELSEKVLKVYVTMAFGNPYGDLYNDEIVIRAVEKLYNADIRNFVFSDITGEGSPAAIERLSSMLINSFRGAKIGIHMHTKPGTWKENVEAAWRGGMRNFESAMGGFGGCPMTGYELIGNLDTMKLIEWCAQNQIETKLDYSALNGAKQIANEIFN